MNNPTALQELINHYRETGSPILAVEVQKSIRQMTPEQKAALNDQLDENITGEPVEPTETFEAGKTVVDKLPTIEKVEIPDTEVVIPKEVVEIDNKIVETEEPVVLSPEETEKIDLIAEDQQGDTAEVELKTETAIEAEEEKEADKTRAQIEQAVVAVVPAAAKEGEEEMAGEEGKPSTGEPKQEFPKDYDEFVAIEGDPDAKSAALLEEHKVGKQVASEETADTAS